MTGTTSLSRPLAQAGDAVEPGQKLGPREDGARLEYPASAFGVEGGIETFGEILEIGDKGGVTTITLRGIPDVTIRLRGHSKDDPDSWGQQLDACVHEARSRGAFARIDVQALSQHSVSMEVLSALLHINRVASETGLKVAFDNVPKSAADRFARFNLPTDNPSYLDISSVLIPPRANAKGEAA